MSGKSRRRHRCVGFINGLDRHGASRGRPACTALAEASRKTVEKLEPRQLLSVSWNVLSASGPGPSNGQAMMLLSDGSVLVQGGSNQSTTTMYRLSPQANTGSYVNGVWSAAGSMNEGRLFFSTVMLPDGRVFGIGGEYPKFSNTAEIYDPKTDSWSYVDGIPTPPTGVDLSGNITGASNSSPITITTGNTTAALKNGDSVTISGVSGNTAANGTWTIANLTSSSFDLVGSSGNGGFVNDGNGGWSGPATSQYGDDPLEVLPNGQVLAGYFNSGTTYLFNPAAASGSQWTTTAGGKVAGDRSDEEAWVKLPDNSILSYDVFASQGGTFQAQRYVPSTNSWVNASTLGSPAPSILSDPTTTTADPTKDLGQGSEMGPGFLLPDGRVFYFGANGKTAYYTPSTDTWTAGPQEPSQGTTQLAATDDPGAMLPNGHILIALSPLGYIPVKNGQQQGYNFPTPSYIYEYDPVAQTFTDVSPGSGGRGGNSISDNAYGLNMVVLPTGQVLLADEQGALQVFNEDPSTGPQDAWRPTISNIVSNGDGTYTLTGTQLNGISEGANYGDDNESASNYPILQFTDGSGNIFYARTYNWSSTGVATGSTPVTTQFTLPAGHTSLSDFTSIVVIANGIPSNPVWSRAAPNVTGPANQTGVEGTTKAFNLGSFIDPDGSPWSVDVNWGDGTSDTVFTTSSDGSLGSVNHAFPEEGSYTPKVTVTDSTSLSGSALFNVAVSDPAVVPSAVPVNAVEGQDTGSVPVATFVDPGGPEALGDYAATIDWGDGTTTTGTITLASGTFTVLGDHTYAEESAADHPGSNPYLITVTINHEAAPAATVNTSATVSDPAVTPTGGFAFSAVEGVPSATQTVATFTDPGGAETVGDYSALIDWGDGTTSAGTITLGTGGVYTVQGSHTYATGLGLPDDFGNTFCDANPPTYNKPITVTISHESAPTATAVSTATIALPPDSAHLTSDGNLIVVGTTGDDDVQITPVGNTGAVRVSVNNGYLGSFPIAAGDRIIVAALAGNDNIQVAGGVRAPAVLYGGPGDDRIKGGGGPAIEVGCDGNDTLTGGNANDLLVAGDGADRLVGGSGSDILIAGNLVDATLTEDTKFSDLIAVLNGGPVHALSGGGQDTLTGSAGNNTYYYHFMGAGPFDKLTGKKGLSIDI